MTVTWEVRDGELVPVLPNGTIAAWAAQAGSQEAFITCPVFECLYEGNRGGGKTLLLVMAFAQHCEQGHGHAWRGILFRQTYPQLADVISKTKEWLPRIFPERVKFNEQRCSWTWENGEELLLRHMKDKSDYWSYHGHSYPFVAFEELTTWPSDECYTAMMSVCRSPSSKIPRMFRSTTNPYGAGHTWVKMRFQLPIAPNLIVGPVLDIHDDKGKLLPEKRVSIRSKLIENKVLLHGDPGYIDRLRMAASNEAQLKAWTEGDWDIVSGGMIDDVWNPAVHRIPAFTVPASWRLDRAFDWGSARPFSVGWWAESDGSPLRFPAHTLHTLKGDLFRVAEWYGWRPGRPNEGIRMTATEIAAGVLEREASLFPGRKVRPGPADAQIFDSSTSDGTSVAKQMASAGCRWTKADKGPGSRINGWQRLRNLLQNAIPPKDGTPRERPGMFVSEACPQFMRTVPVLPRDDKNLDDVDTEAEDHVGDECRYRVYQNSARFAARPLIGH